MSLSTRLVRLEFSRYETRFCFCPNNASAEPYGMDLSYNRQEKQDNITGG